MSISLGVLNSDAAILARVVRPEQGGLPNESAQALLRLRFEPEDLARIHDLVTRNQDDLLTLEERAELESYLRISALLDLVRAWANQSARDPV